MLIGITTLNRATMILYIKASKTPLENLKFGLVLGGCDGS